MKYQLCILLCLATSFGICQQANASDTTDTGRVSAVVELSDGELQSLLQTGIFKMKIPASHKNKVNSLILKRPDRYKDDVAVLFNDVNKRSNTIAISIDDSTIEQIAYQPVELKIYESGYTNILVRYRPGNGIQQEKPSKYDSVELKIMLLNGKTLTGRLSEMTQFPLKSSLGKVNVKLKEVSQITFDEDGELKVTTFDGDVLTGKSNFSSVIVNSRWGQEKIKIKDIASIAAPLSPALSTQNASIPTLPPTNYGQPMTYGQPTNYGQPMNFGQPHQSYPTYPQHQFPMETGRIDTLPSSPRQMNRVIQQPLPMGMPMETFLEGSIMQPQSSMPLQGYNAFPSNGMIYGEFPSNQIPMNQVPMSEFPIDNLPMGQTLPQMNPTEANDFWLFPQN